MTDFVDPESHEEFSAEEVAWISSHMNDLRRGLTSRRFRNLTLGSALAIGLVVHVLGFMLKSSVTGEVFAVLADVLYTLGFALWTGVVVVAIVEIIPEAKERQISGYLDAYERALRSRTRPGDRVPSKRNAP
jgi:hypothetical protein